MLRSGRAETSRFGVPALPPGASPAHKSSPQQGFQNVEGEIRLLQTESLGENETLSFWPLDGEGDEAHRHLPN